MRAHGLEVRHVDLSEPRAEVAEKRNPELCIFWWRQLPLGMQPFSTGELPLGRSYLSELTARFAAEQRAARDPELGAPLKAGSEGIPRSTLTIGSVDRVGGFRSWLDGISEPSQVSAEDLAVIICTRDREEALSRCIRSVLQQRSPPGEILVVDNSAEGTALSVCQGFPGVIYLHERQAGLSFARNAGIHATALPFVAFTDDDVEVHPNWTAELMRSFRETSAEALTGLVLPARLETEAQSCFQFGLGGFGARFVPVLFDQEFFSRTVGQGAQVWRIGAGANMAFRRSVFDRIGLFDTRLGAGASGCSEDSEYWYRILAAGGSCFYEPKAVVYHDHRADWKELTRQVRSYMQGHVSALVAQYDLHRHRGNLVRTFVQLPRYFAKTALDAVRYRQRERRRLLYREVLGWLSGMQYLVRPRWRREQPPVPERQRPQSSRTEA